MPRRGSVCPNRNWQNASACRAHRSAPPSPNWSTKVCWSACNPVAVGCAASTSPTCATPSSCAALFEGIAARRAAEIGADADRLAVCDGIADRIDAALGRDARSVDFDLYASLNDAFHRALVDLCESDVIRHEYERITRLPMAGPSCFLQAQAEMTEVRTSLFVAQAQHRALIDAIRNRGGARAEALAREHAHLAQHNLREVLTARHTLRSTIPGLALVSEQGAG
jgi:hypothetical protein